MRSSGPYLDMLQDNKDASAAPAENAAITCNAALRMPCRH